MVSIELLKNDITQLNIDAIVNAANKTLLGGGGVDGAIHRAAGPALLKECKTLGGCNTGEAKITKGYNLPAKWIIHTVGPVFHGNNNEHILLGNCYFNCLKIAEINKIESIAFPNISTGIYGYPKQEAAETAIKSVNNFIQKHSKYLKKIVFVTFDNENYLIYKEMLNI